MRTISSTVVIAGMAALAAWSQAALAAPCAGFVDVDDASPFCANVQWIRNRAVTLGCSTPSSYCPGDPVLRASMALFMQRLGIALASEYLQGAQAFSESLDPAPVRCVVTTTAYGWPRVAEGIGSFTILTSNGAADVAAQFVESTDFGTTWTAVSPIHAVSVGDQQGGNLVLLLGPRLVAQSAQVQYGLRISRVAGSPTTGNPQFANCRSRLSISNRNPTTPPFDE